MDRVTPEWVMSELRKHNEIVTREQAQQIIEFLRRLATIEIDKILNYEDSGPVCKSKHG